MLAVNPTGVFGGAELALLRLLRRARDRGWDVQVAVPDGPLAVRIAEEGFARVTIPDLKLGAGPRLAAMARTAREWRRAARILNKQARETDVVVANGMLALPTARLTRLRAPVVWVLHDIITRKDWRLLTRMCVSGVRLAIAPSRAVAASLPPDLEVRVVPNGTPWPVDPAHPRSRSEYVVGIAGAITPLKGHDVLLEAIAGLRRDDVILEVVGGPLPKDTEYHEEMLRRAGAPDLAGRVRFLGQQPDATSHMRDWDVAVSASVRPEAAPLVILEAMSVGVPVVATDHGGSPEELDGAGLLVPPGDAAALGDAIVRLLDDEELRVRCASRGREQVSSRYQLDKATDAAIAIIEVAAAREPTPGRVTWVVPDFVPGSGGTTRQTVTVAEGLRARGHRVRIVARRRTRAMRRREVYHGLSIRRLGMTGSGLIAEKISIVAVAFRLTRPATRRGVVQVLMYPDFVVSALLADCTHHTVMTWAGIGDATDSLSSTDGAVRRLQHKLRRIALGRAVNTVLTPALGRELATFGLPSEVLPLPVDRQRYRPPTTTERGDARAAVGLECTDLVVVYTGPFRRLKAIDRLVSAFACLRATGRNAHLLLVGAGSGTPDSCEDELEEQIRRLGLEDSVTITGFVPDVRPYLWASDVFVLPSEREGMPNSLLEAMAIGLPCVVPEQPVGADVLGDAGVVTPDNEPKTLATALVALADDPERRACLAGAAEKATEAWTLDVVLDKQEQLYDRVAQRTKVNSARARRMAGQAVGVARALPVLAGARWHGNGGFVLTYHDVTDDEQNPTDTVSPAQLREQLTTVRRMGVEIVGLPELTRRLLAGERVDHLAAVAFDDAFRGVQRAALPVLLELDVPATVFVVSDRLGTEDPDWYPGADRTMTPDELAEVVDAGLTIGSHTRTHPPLVGLDREVLGDELAGSRAALRALTGQPVDLFAYPGGYYDSAARAATEDAGYLAAFTFRNGRLVPGLDRFRLPRLSMGSGWGASRLAYTLARPAWSFREHQSETVAP